jgi:hypothetical protein
VAVRKETIKAQVREWLSSALEPGEREVASVNTIAGPSPWLATGLLGLIGQAFIRYYYVVVTDRRILFVNMSRVSGRPKDIAIADPRSAVSVVEYRPASLWSVLKLNRGEDKPLKLHVHRIWREELDQVAKALGASTIPEAG